MTEQLERIQSQNTNLKEQLRVLREKHEYTVLELIESKQNQEKLKKLNDALTKTIQETTVNFQRNGDLKIVIEGQLTSKRIQQLEEELDHYRMGVNASVDRRVRQIVKGYSQLEEQDKSRSRLSYNDRNSVNINYNLVKNEKSISDICLNCSQLEAQLAQRSKHQMESNVEIEQLRADRDIFSAKLDKMQALLDTLKRENKLLKGEIARLEEMTDQIQQHDWQSERTYACEGNSSRNSFGRVSASDAKGKENMIRQITSIVNGMSSRKQGQIERGRSRVLPIQDSNALFSIKNGINRPSPIYY